MPFQSLHFLTGILEHGRLHSGGAELVIERYFGRFGRDWFWRGGNLIKLVLEYGLGLASLLVFNDNGLLTGCFFGLGLGQSFDQRVGLRAGIAEGETGWGGWNWRGRRLFYIVGR